ncbi:MAG: cobalamin biosynthesis protein [Candidatus Bathyarchaeota archaeon]|nr:cobalamin biosynthesis protein [Candidatus Bathyarchaeota archaeon]
MELSLFTQISTAMLMVMVLALIIDLAFGEPMWKWRIPLHPTVWVNKFVFKIMPAFKNKNPKIEQFNGVLLGLIAIAVVAIPVFLVLYFCLALSFLVYILLGAFLLKLTMCIKLETQIATQAAEAMKKGDLATGRECVGMFSRRKTEGLTNPQIASGIIESMAENLTDFKLSPLFYYSFFGVTGAMVFKVINILDGTVGFKDKERINLGWFSAKLDTVVNYPLSRLTAFFIMLAAPFAGGSAKNTWKIMFRDAKKVPSTNHGWPMAAIAGALNVELEKPGIYIIGDASEPLNETHIYRALKIRDASVLLFILLVALPIILVTSWFFGLRI